MNKSYKILVVDDETSMREFLEVLLSKEGYQVAEAKSGKQALNMIQKNEYDLVLTDIRLGDLTGLEILRQSKRKNQDTIVIMISAYSTTEIAVEAMNEGAYDFVPKPFDNQELKHTIKKALEMKTLDLEKECTSSELQDNLHFNSIIGRSPGMQAIYKRITQVGPTKTNVLITGESGTGKELIARAIHDQSNRKDKPFVVVNCGGIPDTLIESEFFGHIKGSFTGAVSDKQGLFEAANKGTIFLDEIGDVSPVVQVKLLRVLQERTIERVGDNKLIPVNVRVVSATNRNLDLLLASGQMREDFYYRIKVVSLVIPPLRDRREDIPLLVAFFLDRIAGRQGLDGPPVVAGEAMRYLMNHAWPGNVRELENSLEHAMVLSRGGVIKTVHFASRVVQCGQ